MSRFTEYFTKISRTTEKAVGAPITFIISTLLIIVWLITGPFFEWSDTWQLIVNTATTVITFLMVFLIQSTQTRDTAAIHLKLDELIRVDKQARNELVDLEDRSTDEIRGVKEEFKDLHG